MLKIYGDLQLDEEVEGQFTKGKKRGVWLAVNSGTIELKDNKIVVLAS